MSAVVDADCCSQLRAKLQKQHGKAVADYRVGWPVGAMDDGDGQPF